MRRSVMALAGGVVVAFMVVASPAAAVPVRGDPAIYRMTAYTGYDASRGYQDAVSAQVWIANATFSGVDSLRVHFVATYTTPGGNVVRALDRTVWWGGTSQPTTGISAAWSGNSSIDPVPDAALVPAGATALSVTAQLLRWSAKAKTFVPLGTLRTAAGPLPPLWQWPAPGVMVFDASY